MAAPSITIQSWPKTLKGGERASVLFALAVPEGQQIVSIVATLTSLNGQKFDAIVSATNANVATGILLPVVPAGYYRLTMQIASDTGGTDATALKRDVVVS